MFTRHFRSGLGIVKLNCTEYQLTQTERKYEKIFSSENTDEQYQLWP